MKAKHEMMPKGEAEERYMMDKRKARKISISVYVLFMVIAVAAVIFFLSVRLMAPETAVQSEGEVLQLLEEQPIDDTHDAFLVDTGGMYGILLVTVEIDPQNTLDDFDMLLHFNVWNPKDREIPLQTMDAKSSVFHWSEVIDANFDGYQDFGYMYAMGNQPQYWHFWIWDEAEGQFREEPEFDKISCPEFREETRSIHGWNRSSAMGTGEETVHQWIDGGLVCVRRMSITYDQWKERIRFVVEERIDNGMREVYSETFPADSTEYLDISAKWQNLNYHGEP